MKIGDTSFYEKINYNKLSYILNNQDTYKTIIENEEKKMRRNKDKESKSSVWATLKKIIKSSIKIPNTEYAYIPVSYNKGICSNNEGRWYAKNSIGLAPLCSCVRHTICDGIWVDIDQVNSHPSIMLSFMKNFNYNSPILNECINNREVLLNKIMIEENCDRDDAKNAVISCINGKCFKTNILKQLMDEIKPCINHINNLPEYSHIKAFCISQYGSKNNLMGKVISRILQIIENNLLECYINFSIEKDLIPTYKDGFQASLIFDGFQLINNSSITHELLNEMAKDAFTKTGYNIPLKIKPFDNKLVLPENYYEILNDVNFIPSDILDYDDYKANFENKMIKIQYPSMIYNIEINLHLSIKSAKEAFLHLPCKIKNKDFKYEIKPFFSNWLSDKDIRCYEKLIWKPPPLICDEKDFNSWKPFKILNQPLLKTDRDFYKEFLDYSSNLFGCEKVTKYVLARYAYRLQNPGKRSYICVVYFGEEGDGKSKFIDTIYKVFGAEYTCQIDTAKKLYDSHSTYENEKLFICVNDAAGNDSFENDDILKTKITEDKLYINPKGIQAYEIDNLNDYDKTTNNLNVVKLNDKSMRRWFQLSTTSYYNSNYVFFNDYVNNIINNPIAIRQIYEGLINYDWKEVVPSCNFQDPVYKPYTDITREVKECNRDKLLIWLNDFVNMEKFNGIDEEKIKSLDLFNEWKLWCCDNDVKLSYNTIQFGIKISQLKKSAFAKYKLNMFDKDTHNYYTLYIDAIKEYIQILFK
jgi:hypothetical protein